MNKFLCLLFCLLIVATVVVADDYEYTVPEKSVMVVDDKEQSKLEQIYRNLSVPTFSYQHNIDPEQYYDMQNTTWSPYPLLRLNSALYFKNVVIEPGYYLLTPREQNGNWYILFKEAGKVKHIIPVYEKGFTPETFYKDNIPEPKLDRKSKTRKFITDFAGKFKSSQRPKEKSSYLEVNDMQNNFLQIILYWGDYKYYTVFRSVPL